MLGFDRRSLTLWKKCFSWMIEGESNSNQKKNCFAFDSCFSLFVNNQYTFFFKDVYKKEDSKCILFFDFAGQTCADQ